MDGVKCKSLLALNFKENEALKISPIGEITGLDGRVFNIDAKTLLESIAKIIFISHLTKTTILVEQ